MAGKQASADDIKPGIALSGPARLNRAITDANFAPASVPAGGGVSDPCENAYGFDRALMIGFVNVFTDA